MKRILAVLLLLASCHGRPQPSCGNSVPPKPAATRTPSFFGRVMADPHGWTVQRDGRTDALVNVGGHEFAVNARTERLNRRGCAADPTQRAAFVGLRRAGLAAWVLFANPQRHVSKTGDGRYETRVELGIGGVMVWRVQHDTIVLTNGVALPITRPFAHKLDQVSGIPGGLREQLEGPQIGAILYVDPRTGEVLDALPQIGGCA